MQVRSSSDWAQTNQDGTGHTNIMPEIPNICEQLKRSKQLNRAASIYPGNMAAMHCTPNFV